MNEHLPTLAPALIGPLYLLAVTIPLSLIDIRKYRLPNRWVLPALPLTLTGQLLATALGQPFSRLLGAFGVAFAIFIVGLLATLRGLVGMGDTKLLVAIALALGWFSLESLWLVLLVAFAGAGCVLLVRAALQLWNIPGVPMRLGPKTKIPLGPYLLAGHLAALVQVLTTAVV